jgi:hypothetical protein
MPKITYTASKGLVQEAGVGVSFESLPFSPAQTIARTADVSVTSPGVYVLSSSQGNAHAVTLPAESAFPGANFVFRIASADAFTVVGTNICGRAGGLPAGDGTTLTFPATIGTSVVLVSDGLSYCVTAGSGSVTIA